MSRITHEQEYDVLQTWRETRSIRKAARFAGCSFWSAKRIIRDTYSALAAKEEEESTQRAAERTETENASRVSWVSDEEVVTQEDAIKRSGADMTVWRVKKWGCTAWTTILKIKEKVNDAVRETPVRKQQWRVSVDFERIIPRKDLAALDAMIALVNNLTLKAEPVRTCGTYLAPKAEPHLMVVDLVDAHFGKLAWAPETGSSYDLDIAAEIYWEAVQELLRLSSNFMVDEFLLPIGSDFFHIDNTEGNTTAGTPQDCDGRLAKIISVGTQAVVDAVGLLAERGKVVLRWVPGNHDRLTSFMLAHIVKARFHNQSNVIVDVGPSPRKYHRYGLTLVGLTHGNEEKHSELPIIMATERPQDWAATTCHEWHVGHEHKSKQLKMLPLETHGGVLVRTLRSLSGTDAWHHRKGFVGAQRSAEAFLYDRNGYRAAFCADVHSSKGAA